MSAIPEFKPYDRVAVRMPMQDYPVRAGDMLYFIEQCGMFTSLCEEARTGHHHYIRTLDLDLWTR